VKVIDFGIAGVPLDGTATDLTGPGQVVGTVSYMSPEQTRGERVDPRSDIFSLGCVLYQAATGRLPFQGPSMLAIMHEIATSEPDPGFADAWGLLAQAYGQMGSHLDPDPKWFDLSEQAIARTLELDPVQCDALCARGMILWSPSRRFQNRAALRALNAALKINPLRQTARHLRSAVLWHLGFVEAATEDAEALQLANPAFSFGAVHLSNIALQRGDFQQAADYIARALSLDPTQVLAHLNSPVPLLWAGRLAEAREALDKTRQIVPSESFVTGLEAIFSALEGNFGRAEALADDAAQSVRSLTHTHHTWHYCAGAYALSGKPEKALAELQRSADLGLPNYRLFEMDPYLQSLRTNPAFRDLMTSLRREHDSIREEFGLEAP
jgi:serine/threonine protein kinase